MAKTVRIVKPQLMPVTSSDPVVLQQTLNKLVEAMQPLVGQNPNKLEKAITFADLNDSGFSVDAFLSGAAGGVIGMPITNVPDPVQPPKVQNFDVVSTWDTAILTWDPAGYQRHAYVEVWRAKGFIDEERTIPTTISDAVYIGQSPTVAMADSVISNHYYRYWVRNVSQDGLSSDWHLEQGTEVFAPRSPSEYISIISGEIKKDDLYITLGEEIDKIEPMGVLVDRIPLMELEIDKIPLLELDVQELAVTVGANETAVSSLTTVVNDLGVNSVTHTSQIAANTTSLSNLTGLVSSNTAAVTEQSEAIANLESATASHTTQINAATTQNNANSAAILVNKGLITTQGTAITTLEGTTATHTTQIAAVTAKSDANGVEVAANKATITSHGVAITSLNSAVATHTTQISAVTTAVDEQGDLIADNTAIISTQATAITDLQSTTATHTTQISAATNKANANGVQILANSGLITTQGTAITNLQGTTATHTTQIAANTAAIDENTDELVTQSGIIQTHSSAITSLNNTTATQTTQISAVTAKADANGVKILANEGLITTQGAAISTLQGTTATHTTQISAVTSKANANGTLIATNSGLITAQATAISDLEGTTATHSLQISAVTESVDANSALITQYGSAITTLNSSSATHTTQISATTAVANSAATAAANAQGTANTALGKANTNAASIVTLGTAVTGLEDAQASLTTQVSANEAIIEQHYDVTVAQGALINASYTVKIDTGNVITGFGLMTDATGVSRFAIRADRFYIAPPSTSAAALTDDDIPFIVNGNDTLIKNAYIDTAYIETLVTGSLIANKITGVTITGVHLRGGDLSVGNNFTVDGYGNLTATNGYFHGNIQANTGVLNNVTINENCTVLGTMQANRIIGDVQNIKRITSVPASGKFYTSTKTASLSKTKIATFTMESYQKSRLISFKNLLVGFGDVVLSSGGSLSGTVYAQRANGTVLKTWSISRSITDTINSSAGYQVEEKFRSGTTSTTVWINILDGILLPANESVINFYIAVTVSGSATYEVEVAVTENAWTVANRNYVEIQAVLANSTGGVSIT